MRRPLVAVALLALLAGCAAPSSPVAPASKMGMDGMGGMPAPVIAAKDCAQAGGFSTYNADTDGKFLKLPAPFQAADVREDVGAWPITFGTTQEPALGKQIGNYHASFVCREYSADGVAKKDLRIGFVGMKVDPPPFDPPTTDGSPITAEYIIVLWSVSDPDLRERYHMAGLHATEGQDIGVTTDGALPGVIQTILDDKEHGVYESIIRYKEVEAKKDGTIRLWLFHGDKGPDGKYHPIPLDMSDAGGKHLEAEVPGWFQHTRTDDHAPLPGAYGDIVGLAYAGFARTIALPPDPRVAVDENYEHL